MRLIVRLALVIVGCLLLVIGGVVAHARRGDGASGMWIYYASIKPDGTTSLYRMLSNGVSRQVVVENTGFITRISFSPDGRSIVFDAEFAGEASRVYRADLDGSNVTEISSGFDEAYAPAWSPDGQWIALMVCNVQDNTATTSPSSNCYPGYGGSQPGIASVYIMRPDGSERRKLADSIPLGRPFWSPNGEWIAYVSPGINDADIARIRVDGTDQQRLTDADLAATYADKPPFIQTPNQPVPAVPIFPSGGRDLSPSWSADGSQIAFLSNRFDDQNGSYYDLDVFVMNADGSDITRLTDTNGQTGAPQWSPDGEWIAFVDDSENVYNIYRIRPDGSDLQQLTHNTFRPPPNNSSGGGYALNDQSNSWAPAWSPQLSLAWPQQWAFIGGGLLVGSAIITHKRHPEFSTKTIKQKDDILPA